MSDTLHVGAPADGGDPKASGTMVAAIIGALVVVAIVIALEALFYTTQEAERSRKVIGAVPEELTRLRAEQLEPLTRYGWVDPSRGVVAVPIERAMELTVRDQGSLPAATLPPAPAAKSAK